MMMLSRIAALFFLSILLNADDLFARSTYVAELQQITQRTGPSTDHRIVKMLPSGALLTVLEESDGWLRVRDADGSTGWVLQRFTTTELPARLQLEQLRQEHEDLRETSGGALGRIAELEAAKNQLESALSESIRNHDVLEREHATLLTEAAHVVELRERHDTTMAQLEQAQIRVRQLSSDNEELRASERLRWFLFGGGVVFTAWFFGFLSGRMQRKRRAGLQY
ncbi:TIGR04211 family SH3 domain-containing protein [Desulfonatronum thiodismutans]|uniref:TIGR04211 family SH3 domain-containing protein n=1 Tax=Desulfonatronum thiodismutans TaxID=159290 RepID=UPI0004ABE460|nr:TIGR04211 family SH3 domain-containing protein [Desulfonatronum thiodismutans]